MAVIVTSIAVSSTTNCSTYGESVRVAKADIFVADGEGVGQYSMDGTKDISIKTS